MLVALSCGFRTVEGLGLAFDIATQCGTLGLGLGGYGVAVGCVGDVVLEEGDNLTEAILNRPPRPERDGRAGGGAGGDGVGA